MPVDTQRIRELASLVRSPRDLARHARSNIELWANLFIIGWAIAFMFWQALVSPSSSAPYSPSGPSCPSA